MKKVLSVLLSLAMLLSTVAFALPAVELDTAESAAETVQLSSDTAELAAEIKPGINFFTGTSAAATFDDEAQAAHFVIGSENGKYQSKERTNLNDGTYNNVMSFYRAGYTTTKSNWAGIQFNNTKFDGVRKYRFSLDYQFSIPTYPTGTGGYWGGFTSVTASGEHKTVSGSAAVNNWQKWSMDVVPKSNYTPSFRFWIGVDGDNGTCDELHTYIDNVSVIPYYIANYHHNDGTDATTTKQFLYDANGNMMTTYTPDASVVPVRDGYVLKGWSTSADSTELVDSVTLANTDVDLYAVWTKDTSLRKTVKPGLNMVVANPLSDDVNGSALVYGNSYTSASFPDVTFALPSEMDGNRPIYVSFKYYKDYTPSADEEGSLAENLWVMKNGGTYKAADINRFFPNEGWKKFSGLVNFNAAYNAGNTSEINKDPVKSIIIKTKINANPGAENQYFDDIMYIPSYKITYMPNDGTDEPVATKYALLDADGNIITSYTPDATVEPAARYKYTFLGWATEPDATEPVESVALNNEDIVLYALWEEDESLPDEAELKWDFETEESQTWSGAHYNRTYKNGMMILDSSVKNSNDHYVSHETLDENDVTNTDALRYLVIKARSLGDVSNIKFYFSTTDYGCAVNETETFVNIPLNPNSTVFTEYYVDMTKLERWSGNYKNCMLQLTQSSGVVEIEEIKFVTNYEPVSDVVYEHHFDITTTDEFKAWGHTFADVNEDGTVNFGKKIVYITPNYDKGEKATHYYDEATDSYIEITAANPMPEGAEGYRIQNQGAAYAYIKGADLDASIYNKLVVKTKDTTLESMKFYWLTSEFSGYAEGRTASANPTVSVDGYTYYILDFSTIADYNSGLVKEFMITSNSYGEATVYDVFLTNKVQVEAIPAPVEDYVWDFEGNAEPGISAWSGHTSISFEDNCMVIVRSTAGGSGGIDVVPQKSLMAEDYPYLVAKVKKPANGATIAFNTYYVTGNMASISGSGCVSSSKVDFEDDTYDYYLTDFRVKEDYAIGNLKKFVFTTGSAGTWYVEELIATDDLSFIGIEKEEDEEPEVIKIVEKVALYGGSSITEDHGTTTLYPYIRYTDGSEEKSFKGVKYITDSVCAQVVTNADGSATVTGQIDGTVNIKVILADGTSFEKKITVSGQAERIAANDFNVVMFGNSIRKHGPSPGIGWPADFNWGMAASTEEQDYAHRFVHYMEEKYGEGTVTLYDTTSIAAFERAIIEWETSASKNAEIKSSVATFVKEAVNSKADIVTFQLGENAGGPTEAEYYSATKYMVSEIQKALPDALIVVCTPFWGGTAKIDGITKTAKELGIPVVDIHKLNTRENYAYDGTWITDATIDGVKIHPGDTGMDNIAKMIFEQTNILLSADEKTVYTTTPKSVEITYDATSITEAYGKLELSAAVLPSDASQDIVWTSSDKDIATVDENGVVSAYNDGAVTITATSRHKSDVYATIDIEITGQTKPNTVTYHANTDEWVDNMPEANTKAKLGFRFDDIDSYPSCYGFRFLGWALKPDATEDEVLTVYDVTEDIDVYAIWEEAYRWDWERDGYKEEFTIDYGFNQYVLDGKFMSIATDTNLETGAVLKVNSPGLNINPKDYYSLVIRMQNTEITSNTTLDLTFMTSGEPYTVSKPVVTTDVTEYEFLLDDIDSIIMGFSFTPTNVDCTINIDHIEFMKAPEFTYDVNAGTDAVGNAPASVYEIVDGKVNVPKNVLTRTGYTFLGWVTDPSSKLIIESETVPAVKGGKLYAAWDKNDHWEFDSLEKWGSGVGNATTYEIGEDGVLYIMEDAGSVDITVGLTGNVGYDVSTTSKALKTRMKYDLGTEATQSSQIFFRTSDAPDLAEGNSGRGGYYKPSVTEDFVDYTIDLNYKTNFTGTLNSFRWDPFQCYGEMWIDYIRFTDSEANRMITDGEAMKLFYDDDWATFIVRKGGVLAPVGGRLVKNLAISGDIDMTEGYLMVSGNVEIADDADYMVYTLNMASVAADENTKMYISGSANAVDMTDGANYIVKLYNGVGFVAFEKNGAVTIYKLTKNADTDGDLAVTFVNYNGTRVADVDILTAADYADGFATVEVADGCTAKIITLENAASIKPVFADITIG